MTTLSHLRLAEAAAALVSIMVGWYSVIDQSLAVGWSRGGGTAWLASFAVVASIGGLLVALAVSRRSNGLMALGLVLAATAPTGFAYVPNLACVVLAIVELVRVAKNRTAHV